MRNARTGIRLDAMTATCAMRKSQSAAHWRMTMDDILDRLKAACIGHPYAKIPWPHRLLHDTIDTASNSTESGKPLNHAGCAGRQASQHEAMQTKWSH